jgi:hypothetical protein
MAAAMARNPVFVPKYLFDVPEYPVEGVCSCRNVSPSNMYQILRLRGPGQQPIQFEREL